MQGRVEAPLALSSSCTRPDYRHWPPPSLPSSGYTGGQTRDRHQPQPSPGTHLLLRHDDLRLGPLEISVCREHGDEVGGRGVTILARQRRKQACLVRRDEARWVGAEVQVAWGVVQTDCGEEAVTESGEHFARVVVERGQHFTRLAEAW